LRRQIAGISANASQRPHNWWPLLLNKNGDIIPGSAFAKSLTIVIAIAGQLYLTILVAMLVGKLLSRPEKSNNKL